MNGERSPEALLAFLDYLARKGLMKKATVSARKAAAGKVLAILEPHESQDITAIDVDDLFSRFSRLEGGDYTPGSLTTYKSRLSSAIDDFRSYQENPMSFRPSVNSRSSKSVNRKSVAPVSLAEKNSASNKFEHTIPPQTSVTILPIPIRSDLTVQIQGLPFDLTSAEAKKIANVVLAMVAEQ